MNVIDICSRHLRSMAVRKSIPFASFDISRKSPGEESQKPHVKNRRKPVFYHEKQEKIAKNYNRHFFVEDRKLNESELNPLMDRISTNSIQNSNIQSKKEAAATMAKDENLSNSIILSKKEASTLVKDENLSNSIILSKKELEATAAKLPVSPKIEIFNARNRHRAVIYNEDEFSESDFTKPPSPVNPHPVNLAKMPPIVTSTLTNLTNYQPALKYLVDLGVDLFEVENRFDSKMSGFMANLNWSRDVAPKLRFLIGIGIPLSDLGSYLTRNPYILAQDVNSLRTRVNYLRSKSLTRRQICNIILTARYWLNFDVQVVDRRLGWLQKTLALNGNEVRTVVSREPRIITFGLGPLKRLCQVLNDELLFSVSEMKQMLLIDPKLYLSDISTVPASHSYLLHTVGLSNRRMALSPLCLRVPIHQIKKRHEFLRKIKRDQYDPDRANYVSLELLLEPSDERFCRLAARTSISFYNHFQKTL